MTKKPQLTLDDVQEIHRAGRLEDAKHGYLEILKANPNDVSALHLLGILYAEEGNLEEAQAYLEQAITLKAKDPVISLHLANILKAKGLFHQASQVLLTILREHPNFAAAYNNLGTVYYAQAKLKEACEAYQKAIDLQPNYVDAYYNLALALGKLNRIQEAINAYQALIELSPAHPGGRFQLGCLLMQQQKYEAAAKQFAAIESEHPYHFETQTNLATCYLKLGKLADAKVHYLRAYEMAPADIQVLFNLGVISMQLGQLNEAIDFYLRTVKVNPNHFDAQNNLAFAYLTLKRNEDALQHFREALRIKPHDEAIRHTIRILTQEKNITTSPPEYVRSLFDSYADHFDAHLTKVLHYQVPQRLYQAVADTLGKGAKRWDILDLGCGTGLCGELFKDMANTLTGVDLSTKMLEIAATKNIYDELIAADIVPFLEAKKAAYDLILAGDVLVYFGDLAALFPVAFNALRPQGFFVFNTEIGNEDEYAMLPSGRFAHSKAYLDKLIQANHFNMVSYEVIPMRTQDQTLIHGHLYILQK